MNRFLFIIFISFWCASCQTMGPHSNKQDIDKTLQSVAEAVSGKPLTKDEVKNLEKQIATDPEARNSLQTIGQAMGGGMLVKYCPVDGERFSGKLEECPVHHVKLKSLEE